MRRSIGSSDCGSLKRDRRYLYRHRERERSSAGSLIACALAITSSSSQSFAAIGIPDLRRAASVRPGRSPGSRISSKPACRGSALTIAASVSASWVKSRERPESIDIDGEDRNILVERPCVFRGRARAPGSAPPRARSPASRTSGRVPSPWDRRAARGFRPWLGSVVGSPCAVNAAFGGSSLPVARACMIVAVRDRTGRHVEHDGSAAVRHCDRDRARSQAGDARAVIGDECRTRTHDHRDAAALRHPLRIAADSAGVSRLAHQAETDAGRFRPLRGNRWPPASSRSDRSRDRHRERKLRRGPATAAASL